MTKTKTTATTKTTAAAKPTDRGRGSKKRGEVQTYLLERGIPFDRPLTPFAGWEHVTFPLFARYFGEFAPDVDPLRKTAAQSTERRFFAKLQSAEFFSRHIAPRLAARSVAATAPKKPAATKTTGLTEEEKR